MVKTAPKKTPFPTFARVQCPEDVETKEKLSLLFNLENTYNKK